MGEYVGEVLLPLGSGLGEKEYRCKVSKFKGNLVRHMLVHTGERNFSCRYGCGACYKNSWNMKKHEVKCRHKKRKQIFKLEQYSFKISVFVCARLYIVCTV